MARLGLIKFLRATRANLLAQATANGLQEGEPYLVTDESRLAVGTGVGTFVDFAKKSEVDGKVNGTITITVGPTAPSSPAVGDLWVDTN